ncbi:MAG: hypothetical protein A7315_06155 [Candidatus Altiarchaeales archaeon WOR_SM1_79]|nr:MAG: hypothetical protein A7315_06155 [Candidatus Altiarchaeales archaeon WOR_SM1_79]
MKLSRNVLLLVAILFLALFLRVYDLDTESLWLDEAFSLRDASGHSLDNFSQGGRPLYYTILHYWINIFGDSEFSVRFPSAIFGFLSVFMIYKIGRLIFDEETGILSSLIMGLSVFHIYYSQDARMYSLMVLLTLCSMYFFIKLLEKRDIWVSVGYIISTILLIYTHQFGLFIIIVQIIYFATIFILSMGVHKINFKELILIPVLLIILILLFAPWTINVAKNVLNNQSEAIGPEWIPAPSITSIISTFFMYSGSVEGGLSYPYFIYINLLLMIFFLILSVFSIINYEKINGRIDFKNFLNSLESYKWKIWISNVNKIYLLFLWLFTPIILLLTASILLNPIYVHRYTIGGSAAFYLLIARGIRNINQGYIKLCVIMIVITISLLNVFAYYNEVNKEQWREVANYVDINGMPGDLVLFNAGFCQENGFNYYSKRNDLIKKPFPEKTRDVDEKNIEELRQTVEGYNRVWLVLSHSHDYKGLIKKRLNESYNLSYHEMYNGIEVYTFGKN